MEEKRFSPEEIRSNLNTRFIGQKIIYFPSVESTNMAAKREALWGAAAGTLVITDEQTAGRGRLHRTWISPRGGLAFSIILRPNIEYLPNMIMLASLAVTYSIQIVTGIKPQIKWPNDVMINGKKVCGILIENDIRKNSLHHTIIGIGINVNLHMPDYPEVATYATSLSDQIGKEISRLDIIRQLLVEMERLYISLPQSDFIQEQWKRRLVTIGQKVKVTSGKEVYTGTAESVTRDGGLILRQQDGSLVRIVAGDVTLR